MRQLVTLSKSYILSGRSAKSVIKYPSSATSLTTPPLQSPKVSGHMVFRFNSFLTSVIGQLNGDHKCIWKNTRHYELCPSNNTPCSNKESKDVYYSAEGCDKDPDFIAIFGRISDAASDRPSTVNEGKCKNSALTWCLSDPRHVSQLLQSRSMIVPGRSKHVPWQLPTFGVSTNIPTLTLASPI